MIFDHLDVVKNIQKETVVHSSSQVEKSGSHGELYNL